MSLHLIESAKLPSRSSRKRLGATASIILHATLVVGVFTAASAAPVLNEQRIETEIVYVAPEAPHAPPRTAAHLANDAPHSATSAPQPSVPIIADLLPIPVEIPLMVLQPDYLIEPGSARDFTRRNSGSRNGTGIGIEPGGATAPSTGVMNDLQVDRQVSVLSGYRTPRYPEALRAAGIEETLNASFVVDTSGRVESGSLEIPDAKHAAFIAAVREALAKARFRPAESHGRRVRQRVVQAFVFSLQRE